MQNYIIETDEAGQELNKHGDQFYPLACYDEYFSKFILKEVIWHWHEEIEIVIVKEGSTRVFFLDGTIDLKTGEGIYINANVMHRFIKTSSEDCRIINFVFKANFLAQKDSKIYQSYIRPVIINKGLSKLKLTSNTPWEENYLSHINEAFDHFTQNSFASDLSVKAHLLEAWALLCQNHRDDLEEVQSPSIDHLRIQQIIAYIQENYMNPLSVKTLAQIADISESECFRLFKRTLHTTPNDYLLKYRLQMAVKFLIETNHNMITICYDTGFSTPSYFAKKFKEVYDLTPKAFRKQQLNRK